MTEKQPGMPLDLAVVATEDGEVLFVYDEEEQDCVALSPEEARNIGHALIEAADGAESMMPRHKLN